MKVPITRKMLIDWAGDQVVKDAESIVASGRVLEASYEEPYITGFILHNNRPLKTSLRILPDGSVESDCPCYANIERGVICSHVIALALTLVRRATDPRREEKYREELRRASRLASVDEAEYIQRLPQDMPGSTPASIHVSVEPDWIREYSDTGRISVICEAECCGRRLPLDEVPRDMPLTFSKEDKSLLFVLDDISEGPARGRIELNHFDFTNIACLLAGRGLSCTDGTQITVNKVKMRTLLRMDLDRESGELIIMAHTELPFMKAGEFPFYVISGRDGWVYGAGNLWPLENVMPDPYHSIYSNPVIIARQDVLRFLKQEFPVLSEYARVESDLSFDLFTVEQGAPGFRLHVRGSPASLSATLYARYGDIELVACKPDPREHFGIPDPDDLMRYTVRNLDAEKAALIRLRLSGLSGEVGDDLSSIVGNRNVLNFLGTHLPAIRRRGWRVDMEGRVGPYMESLDFVTPVVHIKDGDDGNWFDVGFNFEDGQGGSLSPSEIQQAILKGESFIKRGERTILVDTDAIESMQNTFTDCASEEGNEPGHFRLSNLYAAYVKSSLDALDGVDIDDTTTWRLKAGQYNRTAEIESVPLPPPLDTTLRSYQKDGINWLCFLEKHGFCGLLADEMGLGKTVQALAWMRQERCDKRFQDKPALVVCPTSIVENWAAEAERYVPDMKTLVLAGGDRHKRFSEIQGADLVVTSYALLRRDLDQYLEHEFSAAVLDEAQHIKNRSTQNAIAAKKIKACQRLVLTGTPIENSVSDLWSIMDFLMPGYLGSHDIFRQNYELPISRGGQEGDVAQIKLRRKLHPFLLRRLKADVAKDLPDKIEKVSTCALTPDQRMVYDEILKASRQKIFGMVSKKGFNKSRMEILTTLMRLRQICCHLDLLRLPDLKAKYPSSKMELFFELLDEALDSGHRVLVFSQFVSMLSILREEMEACSIEYCYLDGSTKDRMAVVKQFNIRRDIPAFLISLKAGGTGLNLTGADMVIHFDPWWNPAVEDQATDRAHRIGQKRAVYSIKLITRDTVEEKVLAMQKKKKAIINATIESDEKMPTAMTWEDVQELLSL